MTPYQDTLQELAKQIRLADAIVIGAGSGLSSAAGYNHYHWSPLLLEGLRPFYETYGFRSPFEGFYYCYSTPEERWGYYTAYLHFMRYAPTGEPYRLLGQITGDKPCFVLTTNIDMQAQRVFPAEQVCTFQGDAGYFQCCQPCHDAIYDNKEAIDEMYRSMEGTQIPSSLIPRCPHCGRIMVPWVRDDTFLEGKDWKEGTERYYEFLRHWLVEQTDKRILLLELGVGEMTPSIIKLPFWEMTEKNENVFYACLNKKQSHAPGHLAEKSLYLAGDLTDSLRDLAAEVVL